MPIREEFIETILKKNFGNEFLNIYNNSLLIQYLDRKTGAVHKDIKSRRSLTNIYAIYSILDRYIEDFFEDRENYIQFEGYEFSPLLNFCRNQYGGSKIQNHGFNSRVNGEFNNFFKKEENPSAKSDLILANNGKYMLSPEYLYVQGRDISKVLVEIIEKYIFLLKEKDHNFKQQLEALTYSTSPEYRREGIKSLLEKSTEARVFEIISYVILKNHYYEQIVYFGFTREEVSPVRLELYKTGRTNANDGGIDFVMKPLGRFFQVTEVNNYDKYLLDMDKVVHFPITFVVKTHLPKEVIITQLNEYIEEKSGGVLVIKERYKKAIEEVITINELQKWLSALDNDQIDKIIEDLDLYYSLELNLL